MKKLMMVLAMGLALSSVGFARDRDDFNRRPVVRRVEAVRVVRDYRPAERVIVRRDCDRRFVDRRDCRRGFRW
jgi:hypothetical protein